jgi:uncharacterized protein involved in exopolysaccharide biosynthesis
MLAENDADRVRISNDAALATRRQRLVRHGTFDLRLASEIIARHKVTMLTAVAVGLLLSVLYLHVAPRKYAVQLYITAAEQTSSQPKGLAALSSLAGLSLGSEENPKFREFLAAIRSPVAAEAIVENEAMMRVIFPREWSVRDGRWEQPHSYLRAPARFVERILGVPVIPWAPPNAARVYTFLRDDLKVIPDTKSGIVTLELDSERPEQAEALLVTLNKAIDDWMRAHDLQHANDDINYLSQELSKATVQELREALATTLSDQEKARMLASAPLPYISDMLGTPTFSSKPAYPMPIPVLLGGGIIGFVVGFVIAARKYGRR